jgi:hypothetical protein
MYFIACAFCWCVKDIIYEKNAQNGKLQDNNILLLFLSLEISVHDSLCCALFVCIAVSLAKKWNEQEVLS